MSTSAAARALDVSTRPWVSRAASPDVTDIRNHESGRCVLCDCWVLRWAGWRVRSDGQWVGACCDRHGSDPRPVRRTVAERAEAICARIAAGDKPGWVLERERTGRR